MEQLYEILSVVRPDVNFIGSTGLTKNHQIDSLDIVAIIDQIESSFHIEIPIECMKPENFDSAEAIMNMIKML